MQALWKNAPTLAQPGPYATMTAVEYEKCASIHTQRIDHCEYTIRVLSVHSLSPDLNWNALRTQTKYRKYRKYGYWNTALVVIITIRLPMRE